MSPVTIGILAWWGAIGAGTVGWWAGRRPRRRKVAGWQITWTCDGCHRSGRAQREDLEHLRGVHGSALDARPAWTVADVAERHPSRLGVRR